MHSLNTRNEFLRLRAQGVSLASISRQLRVSKPTLIAWNRDAQPELAALALANRQQLQSSIASAANDELAELTGRLTAVKQELFSRALRDTPTAALEEFAGRLRQRIAALPQPQTTCPASHATL